MQKQPDLGEADPGVIAEPTCVLEDPLGPCGVTGREAGVQRLGQEFDPLGELSSTARS